MSRPTATLCKFIGTISLGLLTGLSYTTTTTSYPPLLTLPTHQPASQTFQHLHALTTTQTRALSALSGTSLLLAYVLSPPRGRHPYLLWATLAVGMGYAGEVYALVVGYGRGGGGKVKGKGKGVNTGNEGRTPDSSDEEWEVEAGNGNGNGNGNVGTDHLNGESVREGMEKWRGKMLGRMAVWGVGWAVTVVGLWGDGA